MTINSSFSTAYLIFAPSASKSCFGLFLSKSGIFLLPSFLLFPNVPFRTKCLKNPPPRLLARDFRIFHFNAEDAERGAHIAYGRKGQGNGGEKRSRRCAPHRFCFPLCSNNTIVQREVLQICRLRYYKLLYYSIKSLSCRCHA